MARELGATTGIAGTVTSTIPAGAGLSSSAALECAVGLALGFEGSPVELALAAQRAEHAATGVPTGIMDQLCIAAAGRGTATMIDCHTLDVTHVAVPDDVDVVVRFVAHRTLVGSAYADRVAECRAAEDVLGPLRSSSLDAIEAADLDDLVRRRARHVVTENRRVVEFAAALADGDYPTAGALMIESHRSLADDFETSTSTMDRASRRSRGITGGVRSPDDRRRIRRMCGGDLRAGRTHRRLDRRSQRRRPHALTPIPRLRSLRPGARWRPPFSPPTRTGPGRRS